MKGSSSVWCVEPFEKYVCVVFISEMCYASSSEAIEICDPLAYCRFSCFLFFFWYHYVCVDVFIFVLLGCTKNVKTETEPTQSLYITNTQKQISSGFSPCSPPFKREPLSNIYLPLVGSSHLDVVARASSLKSRQAQQEMTQIDWNPQSGDAAIYSHPLPSN